ncbi:MAG: sporulation integral membrane protein YlbJ, partial [Clostridiaceae bacterium]
NGNSRTDFRVLLGNAVKSSVSTILTIGGFIVLFSVIIRLLTETGIIGSFAALFFRILTPFGIDERIIRGVLSGLFEITTGSRLISSVSGVPLSLQLPAASLIIGWAGLSVHFQVMSIASNTGVSVSPYLLGKLLQGILSALYTCLGFNWLNLDLHSYEPVLSMEAASLNDWLHSFGTSIWMLLAVIILYTLINTIGRFKTGRLK